MCRRARKLFSHLTFGVSLISVSSFGQQAVFPVDFSATLIDYVPPYPNQARQVGRFLVSKGRVREETGRSGEAHGIVTLVDSGGAHEWLLMPDNKIALDSSDSAKQDRHTFGTSSSSMQLFPIDVNRPCADFKDVTCRNLGTEIVDGRSTQKWEFIQLHGKVPSKSYQWIDPRLCVAIKREDRRSGRQMHDLKEGPQIESLFKIPADYHQMPPQAGR